MYKCRNCYSNDSFTISNAASVGMRVKYSWSAMPPKPPMLIKSGNNSPSTLWPTTSFHASECLQRWLCHSVTTCILLVLYTHRTYNCGKLGLTNGSFSAPLTALFFLCLGSELVEGAWELFVAGGFRFARSFLCRSISSLCWFTHSCCLQIQKHLKFQKLSYFQNKFYLLNQTNLRSL